MLVIIKLLIHNFFVDWIQTGIPIDELTYLKLVKFIIVRKILKHLQINFYYYLHVEAVLVRFVAHKCDENETEESGIYLLYIKYSKYTNSFYLLLIS